MRLQLELREKKTKMKRRKSFLSPTKPLLSPRHPLKEIEKLVCFCFFLCHKKQQKQQPKTDLFSDLLNLKNFNCSTFMIYFPHLLPPRSSLLPFTFLFLNNSWQKCSKFPLKLDDFRLEIQRRDQEIMSMAAKMKTLEEQHQVNLSLGVNLKSRFPQ